VFRITQALLNAVARDHRRFSIDASIHTYSRQWIVIYASERAKQQH